jgi:hypothetical protein
MGHHSCQVPTQLAGGRAVPVSGQVGSSPKRPGGQFSWSEAQQPPSGRIPEPREPAHIISRSQTLRRTASIRWITVTICKPASAHNATSSAKGTPRPANPAPTNVMM